MPNYRILTINHGSFNDIRTIYATYLNFFVSNESDRTNILVEQMASSISNDSAIYRSGVTQNHIANIRYNKDYYVFAVIKKHTDTSYAVEIFLDTVSVNDTPRDLLSDILSFIFHLESLAYESKTIELYDYPNNKDLFQAGCIISI